MNRKNRKTMDLWQLKVFASVIDKKNFSKAGEAIYISQPTVSSHIKELEDYFGCRLIDRMGREALPTKAGKLLYSYSKKLMKLMSETESAMADFLGNIKGELTIGGSTIPSGYIIPGLIGPFAQKYPEVIISLISGDTSQVIEFILNGKTEIGIVGAEIENPMINQEKLINDEMKLIVPASHKWAAKSKISFNMLSKEPFLAREHGSGTWKSIKKSMAEADLDSGMLNIAAKMGNTASVIQGILCNAGISILSTIAVKDALETGRLRALRIEGLALKRNFYLTFHKKFTLSPLSEVFMEFIKDYYCLTNLRSFT